MKWKIIILMVIMLSNIQIAYALCFPGTLDNPLCIFGAEETSQTEIISKDKIKVSSIKPTSNGLNYSDGENFLGINISINGIPISSTYNYRIADGDVLYPNFKFTVPNSATANQLKNQIVNVTYNLDFGYDVSNEIFNQRPERLIPLKDRSLWFKPSFDCQITNNDYIGNVSGTEINRQMIGTNNIELTISYDLSDVVIQSGSVVLCEDPLTTQEEFNITHDLRATDVGNWIATGNMVTICADTNDGGAYVAGILNRWGYYNLTTNISHDLRATDQGDWLTGITQFNSCSYDNTTGGMVMVGSNGMIAYYNKAQNITIPYNFTNSNIKTGKTTFNGVCFDWVHNGSYIVGNSGQFYYLNLSANYTHNLSETDNGDFISTNPINSVSCDNYGNAYLVGGTGVFAYYNISTNKTLNYKETDTGNWIASTGLNAVCTDTINGGAYVAGASGKVGYNNASTNVTHDLRTTNSGTNIGEAISGCAFDYTNGSAYFVGQQGKYYWYEKGRNYTHNLTDTETGNWIGTTQLNAVSYSAVNQTVYILGNLGVFGAYLKMNLTFLPEGLFSKFINTSDTLSFSVYDGFFYNTTYDIGTSTVKLSSNKSGIYLSPIFDLGTSQSWKNISWTPGAYYGVEIGRGIGDSTEPPISNPNISINTSGLIVLYHFNNETQENNTFFKDQSIGLNDRIIGNNASCTATTCPVYNISEKIFGNSSLTFNGVDDELTTPVKGFGSTNNITIALWIRARSKAAYDGIVLTRGGSILVGLLISGGTGNPLTYDWNTVAQEYDAATGLTINLNTWYMAAMVITPTQGKVYLMGNDTFGNWSRVTSNINRNLDQTWSIGRDPGFTRYFDGDIDELSMWNRSLNDEEIYNLYRRGALKLNLSVRSCDDSLCSGETFDFDATNSTKTNLTLADNRYFQYQANLERYNYNISLSPELYNVTVHYAVGGTSPPPATCSQCSDINDGNINECKGTCINFDCNMGGNRVYTTGGGNRILISGDIFNYILWDVNSNIEFVSSC